MTEVITLVTALDIDALADDQLAEPRQAAVRRHLARDAGALALMKQTREMNAGLKALKSRLYSDPALAKALRQLNRSRKMPEKIRLGARG